MTYKEDGQTEEDGQTDITLNSPKPILEAEFERLTVAKTEETKAENAATEEVETVAKWQPMTREEMQQLIEEKRFSGKQYRMDCDEKGGGEWWIEGLTTEGEPTEDYISVDDSQLEKLKANGQIWEYGDSEGCWVPPSDRTLTPCSSSSDGAGKFSQPEPEEPDLFEIEDDDDIEDKIDNFLLAVKRGQLSNEQLEAITLAMIVAGENRQNLSQTLAYLKKFHHFTPNQLLSWGFDQIIPREGLFKQFRNAIASNIKPETKVNVSVFLNQTEEGSEYTALLETSASSLGGKSWCTGVGEGLFEECWDFPLIESAEKFVEYCQKFEFVVAAKIDRISSNVLIPPEKLAELGMVSR